MGHMRHEAIIVTSYNPERATAAHAFAVSLGHIVTPIVETRLNGFWTFLIAPDGSKLGWDASNEGDERRAAMIRWLDGTRHEDGSSPYSWVEVLYGDDEGACEIAAHDEEDFRREAGRR
jgi:hypothetical protein